MLLFTAQARGVKDNHYAGDFAFDDLGKQVAEACLAIFGIFFAVAHQHYQGVVCFFLQIAADGYFFKRGQLALQLQTVKGSFKGRGSDKVPADGEPGTEVVETCALGGRLGVDSFYTTF